MTGKKGMTWTKGKKGKRRKKKVKARWSASRQKYLMDITAKSTLRSVLILLLIMIIIIIALTIGQMIFAEIL